jgi:hypothetical protein
MLQYQGKLNYWRTKMNRKEKKKLKELQSIKTELARKAHCYWLPSDWQNALLISDLEKRIEKATREE